MFGDFINWIMNIFSKMFGNAGERPEDTGDIIVDGSHIIEQSSLDLCDWDYGDGDPQTDEDDLRNITRQAEYLTYSCGRSPEIGTYFTISELCASQTATARGIRNIPSETEIRHMNELIAYLLDPIRAAWGERCQKLGWGSGGIRVTSGYRCPALNKAVGGASSSAHMFGWAADTKPVNGRQDDYERFIRNWADVNKDVKFDQIIVERNKSSRWVHIAIKNKAGLQRRQIFNLTAS